MKTRTAKKGNEKLGTTPHKANAKGKSPRQRGIGDDADGGATFSDLCKELGRRINSTENALLCYRAYQAYLREPPDTAHGKGNKLDRDPNSLSFRRAAAEASGVAAATIDALLQVGKAIEPLPQKVKEELVSSSLGNSMRALRKLATSEFDATRAQLISKFVKEEKADAGSATANLKRTLGMTPVLREGVQAKMLAEQSHEMAEGEHRDVKAGPYTFRVEIGGQAGGRVHVTVMAFTGEHKPAPPFIDDAPTPAPSAEPTSALLETATAAE